MFFPTYLVFGIPASLAGGLVTSRLSDHQRNSLEAFSVHWWGTSWAVFCSQHWFDCMMACWGEVAI